MKIAVKPANEAERLKALRQLQILDTAAEEAFDAITRVASSICQTPISLVTLVDGDRQWFKSALGLGLRQTPRDMAFCAHAISDNQYLEVADASQDERFFDNPLVTGEPGIRFYAGAPLVTEAGLGLGTLCVIDREPRQLSETQRTMLADLAKVVSGLLEGRLANFRFEQLMNAAPVGVALLEKDQSIRRVNPALERITGLGEGVLVQQPLTMLLDPLQDAGRDLAGLTLQEGAGQLFTLPRLDGQQVPVELGYIDLGADLAALTVMDFSVRETISTEARKAQLDLQRIIDQIPAMIGYWDNSLRNRLGNAAYLEWFRIDPKKMRGLHIREVIGEDLYQQNLPYLVAVLRGEPQLFEREFHDFYGRHRVTLASYVPDIQEDGRVAGFYVLATDITSLKAAEEARVKAEAQLQAVIDSATDFSIIATDLDGTITLFSKGAEAMLGYRAEDMIGKATPLLIHEPGEVELRAMELSRIYERRVEGFETLVYSSRLGRSEVREWFYRHRDGHTFPVSLAVSAQRDPDGELTGFLGIARDITEQRAYQEGLATARDAAEASSRAKSDFVANMSHEIRTPLNAVLGVSHLLGGTPLSAVQHKYVDLIRASGEALLGILNDILDFSKIEAGKIELEEKTFRLDDVLKFLASIMTASAGSKELELVIQVAPEVPAELTGDRLRLQQVLINLLGNAIKFTERGEVVLRVGLEYGPSLPNVLRFEVIDTGIGIPPAKQSGLFDAFTQADTSTTRRFGGSGLGLAISKRLVGLMGGDIGVRSEDGKGSCFWFTVAFAAAEGGSRLHGPLLPENLRVLLAEDNHSTRAMLQEQMQSWGWQVDCISDQRELPSLFSAAKVQDSHELLLLDWRMVEAESMQRIREFQAGENHTPLVVLIGSQMSQEHDTIRELLQPDAILTKPVTASSLHDAVMQAQGRRSLDSSEPSLAMNGSDARLDNLRLLLVEDNSFNQFVGRNILENAGASVVVAENGLEAVNVLRERPHDFDMVLMDIQMPVMDGFQATTLIRQELKLDLPVLAMSAGVLASERDHCLSVGMNDFIAKPINVEQMLGVILLNACLGGLDQPPPPLAPPPEPEPARPGLIDIDGFFATLPAGHNSTAKFVGLLGGLCDEWPQMLANCQRGWAAGEKRMAMGLLHKARGTAGTLGAHEMAALSRSLEDAMREENTAEVERLMPEFCQLVDQVVEAIRAWLAAHDASQPATAESASTVDGSAALPVFASALAQNNMDACDLYLPLRPYLAARLSASALDALDQAMQSLDFETAGRLVGEVRP